LKSGISRKQNFLKFWHLAFGFSQLSPEVFFCNPTDFFDLAEFLGAGIDLGSNNK